MQVSNQISPMSNNHTDDLFCQVMERIQDCLTMNRKVIDPGQHLYDSVRLMVKSRYDYITHYNAILGAIHINDFLSLKQPTENHQTVFSTRAFVLDFIWELDVLAMEKGYDTFTPVKESRKMAQASNPRNSLYRPEAGMARTDTEWSDFVFLKIISLAQQDQLTLKEYLGPATQYEQLLMFSFVRKVFLRYTSVKKVITSPPESCDVFDHVVFLSDMLREHLHVPHARKELMKVIKQVSSLWPNTVQAAYNANHGHDTIADEFFLRAMGK